MRPPNSFTHARYEKTGSVVLVLLLYLCLTLSTPAAEWKAGVAKAKITPVEALWLSGYSSRDHPSEGTRLDLWAKALVLEDSSGKQGVFITCDLIGIDRSLSQSICGQVMKRHRLDRNQIVINTSHTHTGPVVGMNLQPMYFLSPEQEERIQRYTAFLQTSILEIVNQAFAGLFPASLAWSEGRETFGVNRRNNVETLVPQLRASGNLKGPVDPAVPVLRITNEQQQIRALLFGYACHATVLNDYLWSGDYPGYAQRRLEFDHSGSVAMFVAGCGADVNPLPRRSAELAEAYGHRLAAAVNLVLDGVMQPIAPKLACSYQEIPLPFDELPSREQIEKEAQATDRFLAARAKLLLQQLDRGQSLAPSYPYPIGVWLLGTEFKWISLGGETVVDYSLRLKKELGGGTWVAGYCHDVMAYIPSRRVWTEGGYEGATAMIYYGLPTRWASQVEAFIIGQVHQQVRELSTPDKADGF